MGLFKPNKFLILASALILAMAVFFLVPQKIQAATDSDQDRLSDEAEEKIFHTDSNNPDTDGDGFSDYDEIYHGYNPRSKNKIKLSQTDSDNDGAPDSWEIKLKLDLLNPDTDNDGQTDGQEINAGTDPKSADNQKISKQINVSLNQQKLTYYFGQTKLEEFLISSGVKRMPSPVGDFTILDKVLSKDYGGTGYNFFFPNTNWNLHFTTKQYRYYIHGAYWHNKFGQPMSHGCINVSYSNMARLYNFAEVGTKLAIKP
ncbi:MAG: L,D-transpeptidase family protein [Candidatus Buchananbacteria bacterium]